MGTRTEEARAIIEAATENTPEYMRRAGWHRCSDVLDEDQALFVIEDDLGDPDYLVSATRTCAGFIVWNALKGVDSPRRPTPHKEGEVNR